jgi:hypothetical protein
MTAAGPREAEVGEAVEAYAWSVVSRVVPVDDEDGFNVYGRARGRYGLPVGRMGAEGMREMIVGGTWRW